jgi:hypothetical protein
LAANWKPDVFAVTCPYNAQTVHVSGLIYDYSRKTAKGGGIHFE